MKYAHITLMVKDMDRALKFYHEIAGLEIQQRMTQGDMELVFLGKQDEPKIELIESESSKDVVHKGFSIGFDVDSLDEATKLMEVNGFKLLRGPISPSPIVKFSFFEGPSGEEIQLLENI